MSAFAALAVRWRQLLVALGLVALLAFLLVAETGTAAVGTGVKASNGNLVKAFAGEFAVTDSQCGGGFLTFTLTPEGDGIALLWLTAFILVGAPNNLVTAFDPPVAIETDGTFFDSRPLRLPLDPILITFEGAFDFAPNPTTVSGTYTVGLVSDPSIVVCAATFTAEQVASVQQTPTPTPTPCPPGKVKTAGGCAQPTPTPDPALGAMQVDCDAGISGIQSDCTHKPGTTFQVGIHVTQPPTDGYFQIQAKLAWTAGVVNYLPAAASIEALWEPCDLAGSRNNWEHSYVASVFIGCSPLLPLPAGDTFTGAVFVFEFQCKSPPAAISPPAGLDPDKSVLELISSVNEPEPAQGGTIFLDGLIQPINPALTGATVTCAQPTPTPTPTPTKQPPPGDTDGDGCTDEQENGPNRVLGGQRDFLSYWDFYDTPAGSPPGRDRRVNILDIGALVLRFGTVSSPPPTEEEALADALTLPPDETSYHAAFDRGGPIPGQDLWHLLPPNGSINIIDIGASIVQFGDTCFQSP